jgi:hypothetical protein
LSDPEAPVCVFESALLAEADVAAVALDAAGVPFTMQNQSIHQVFGGGGVAWDPVQIWVPARWAEAARRLLEGEA